MDDTNKDENAPVIGGPLDSKKLPHPPPYVQGRGRFTVHATVNGTRYKYEWSRDLAAWVFVCEMQNDDSVS